MRNNLLRISGFVIVFAILILSLVSTVSADEVNITFEGHFGGSTDAVFVSGNHAYITQGQDFVIIDISDSESPSELSRLITNDDICDIYISDSYAYVASGISGIGIFNVSDSETPTFAGGYSTAGWTNGVTVSDSYAYVAHDIGLTIVDVSSPAPTLAGSYDTEVFEWDVTVSDGYAYVVYDNGLVIVDVSNPEAPTFAGSYDTEGYAWGVAVSDNYAYVADGSNGLIILHTDIQNTAAVTLTVDDDGTADYSSIQAAINAANSGDTILVKPGTYNENVDVYKQLTITSTGGASITTVNAVSGNDQVFDVTADWVNISGINACGATASGKAGIYVGDGISHASVSNCVASNNYYGIYLNHSNSNILKENTPSKNSMHGIRLAYSNNNTLLNNTASSDNACATLLYASSDNTIMNNDFSNSFHGLFMYVSSNSNLVSDNTGSSNDQGGIYLEGNNNTITGNTISNNGDFEIRLINSSGNLLYHNNFDGNNNNAHDDGNNQWDSGIEGNYYSDYTGTDSDNNGIGDTSYPIPGGSNEDRYPLMEPYSSTQTPSIQDRSLLQVQDHLEVYWFQNNKLYWITDWNMIDQMASVQGWESVNTLPSSVFNPTDYEEGPRFITTGSESDGLLIRETDDYKVYLIENGIRRHITYPDVMDLKVYSMDDVIEVSPEIADMFLLGDPIGIEVDLSFTKINESGEFMNADRFETGDTLRMSTETEVTEAYTVETYVRVTFPDGTRKYACYESVDFQIADSLKFSDVKTQLYPGTWHAETKIWDWNEYTFSEMDEEGLYTWEFWYEIESTDEILGWDCQGYYFTDNPIGGEDTTPPYIVIHSPFLDSTPIYNSPVLVSVLAFDNSGVESVFINGHDVTNPFLGYHFLHYTDLNEGLNEITITATDNSDNHNSITETIYVNYYPFDVKITSPNDQNRFTPDEYIRFTGEISGGEPLFTCNWIIDGVKHSGAPDDEVYTMYESLPSGVHDVKLEVVDSNGYSIETDEISIDVSPLEVDSTFRPIPDGYQFGNYGEPLLSEDLFRNTFGVDLDDDNTGAQSFYDEDYSTSASPGVCFGMSATSLLLFQTEFQAWDLAGPRASGMFKNPGDRRSLDLADFYVDIIWNGQYDMGEPLNLDYNQNDVYDSKPRDWGIFPSFSNTVRDWILYYHGLVTSAPVQDDINYYNGVRLQSNIPIYDELKNRISNQWDVDPMVLGIRDLNNAKGHMVAPYEITETEDHRTGEIHIYDPSQPGDGDSSIFVDLVDGTATYNYGNGHEGVNLCLVRLSSILATPEIPEEYEAMNGFGHLLYTDSVGRQLGYVNGSFVNEIPGARPYYTFGDSSEINNVESYYISNLSLKREVYGNDSGNACLHIHKPGSFLVVNLSTTPDSVDEILVSEDGSSVKFISGNGTSSLNLMIEKETNESAQIVCVNVSEIEASGSINVSSVESTIKIKNQGTSKEFNLYLEQIGASPNSDDSIRNIAIEENSTLSITVSNWSNISNSEVIFEHDFGNDGTVDYTDTVQLTDISAPSTIINLQSTAGCSWINWSWTNPYNTDFSHAIVYIDGEFGTNTSDASYNLTDIELESEHTISIRTIDVNGNMNFNWVNDTSIARRVTVLENINFTINKTQIFSGDTVEFNASSIYDPEGIVLNYFWHFGDNTTNSTAIGMCVNHTYAEAGLYNVTFLVIDENWEEKQIITTQLLVEELDTIPPLSITNLTSASAPTWINFTWNNPADTDFNYTEIYLDGIFQTIISEEHFNATGLQPDTDYTISTRTVDIYGNVNQTWVNLTAKTKSLDDGTLKVDFTANTTCGEAPLTVLFSGNSSNALKWSWDIDGDGNEDGNTKNLIYTYNNSGIYNVSLTVTNAGKIATETKYDYIAVNDSSDVILSITDYTEKVLLDSELTYEIAMENTKNVELTNVQLVDVLPSELIFVSSSGATFDESTNTVIFDIDNLMPEESIIFKITVKTAAYGQIENSVTMYCDQLEPISSKDLTTVVTQKEIPEFPTIMIPVLSVIGFAFLLMRRRE